MKFNVIKKADADVAEGLTYLNRAIKAATQLDVSLAALDNRLPQDMEIPKPLLGKITTTAELRAYLTRVQREVADVAVALDQFINQR